MNACRYAREAEAEAEEAVGRSLKWFYTCARVAWKPQRATATATVQLQSGRAGWPLSLSLYPVGLGGCMASPSLVALLSCLAQVNSSTPPPCPVRCSGKEQPAVQTDPSHARVRKSGVEMA
jgi:hypothetical protein